MLCDVLIILAHQMNGPAGLDLSVMASLPVIDQPAQRSAAFLHQLARRMQLSAESALAPLALRPRHLVALTVLRDFDGVTQQALPAKLQLDETNVVGLLNELERGGLITRRRAPDDRRRHIVEITTTGRAQLAKAEFALAAVEDEVLGALDREQRAQLYELLRQAMSAQLADHGGDCLAADPDGCLPGAPHSDPC
jgi:MarR family transcriptional regulator, lower aerobic nicotinate degradation pathway regulator